MIVPRNKLLWWFGLIVAPAAAILPINASAGLAIIAAFVAGALVDAFLAGRRVGAIRVRLPEVVRMTRRRACSLDVFVSSGPLRLRLRLGFPLPEDAFPGVEPFAIETSGTGAFERFEWICRPAKRGAWRLAECWVEVASPLGFWDTRIQAPVSAEFRVHPDLAAEHRKMAALMALRSGSRASRQVGRGREFEKLREYVPGDALDEIHWKATARRAAPITKVFQIERTQEVYVVIDASRLSARASGDDTVLEHYITAGLILGASAQRQGDLFGLVTFSDQVHKFVRARNGSEHYGACRDAVLQLESRLVVPDYQELFTFIRLRLRRRALLVFLTALDDLAAAESFQATVGLIRGQHLVQVAMLQPAAARPLFSSGNVSNTGEIYDRLAGHLLWHKLRDTGKALERQGVRFSLVEPGRLALALTESYLSVKRRQLL